MSRRRRLPNGLAPVPSTAKFRRTFSPSNAERVPMKSAIGRLAAVLLLAAPLVANAQAVAKVYRIGVLSGSSSAAAPPVFESFRQGLRNLGWVEGRNVVIEWRFADYQYDRLPELAAELVRLNVDVIVTPATPATVAARKATATIPIVMVGVGDPVGNGLIASFARPGGNVTGITYSGAGMEIYAKQLELLIETVPGVRRVAILTNPTNPAQEQWLREIQGAGRSLGVALQVLETRSPSEFDGAFAAMSAQRAGAILVVADSMFMLHRKELADLAAKKRLPLLGYRELVEAGGLMSYGPSLPGIGKDSAVYVDKILKGAKPAELPVEQPTTLDLVINLKTAKALGLTIPQGLLVRADQLIK
jgi:putative ABC transport system substrate-binding protein